MSQLYLDRYQSKASNLRDTSPSEEENNWTVEDLEGGYDFFSDAEAPTSLPSSHAPERGAAEDEDLLGVLKEAENADGSEENLGEEKENSDELTGDYTLKNGGRFYRSNGPEKGPGC